MGETEYRQFVQTVIDNVKKNGFPDKKVAFPLEQLYAAAERKGISFNKVLDTLDEILIAHEKTPEKIIFYPKDQAPSPETPANPMDAFAQMAPDLIGNMDPSEMGKMSISEMAAAAGKMMQNMSPEQLKSIQEMYANMSDDERAELMENAKKLGLL